MLCSASTTPFHIDMTIRADPTVNYAGNCAPNKMPKIKIIYRFICMQYVSMSIYTLTTSE